MRTLALCAIARSDLALAEERLREAMPLALELGGWLAVELSRCLVEVLIREDRISEADEVGAAARRSVPEEDGYARAAALLIDASLNTAGGRKDEACNCFDEALGLLAEQRMPLDLGEARVAYGRALRQLGDGSGALVELTGARESLAEIGAQGLVDEIDRELAELTEGAGQAGPLASS